MADKFTRFLQGVGQGITNPKGNLGDARHAARLYLDNGMSRAPRTKFLYHVQFNINQPAVASSTYLKNNQQAIDMLVKQADLPKITFEHEVKNQYNRKRVIYKEIKYEPLNLVFHDDNLGVINALWAQYLSHYSNERFLPPDFWTQTKGGVYAPDQTTTGAPKAGGGITNTGRTLGAIEAGQIRYGLDVDKINYTRPFFGSITIYTLSRKKFNAYTLINPHITSWNHGNVDQGSNNGTIEATMNIVYESVLYGTGSIIDRGVPRGFADLYYDRTPSPLTIGGGQISTIFGPGGLINAGSQIIEDASTIYGVNNVQGAFSRTDGLQAAIKAINFYKSLASLRPENLVAEATNILLTPTGQDNVTSGLPGISFGTNKRAE
jgi:hypothetical protein